MCRAVRLRLSVNIAQCIIYNITDYLALKCFEICQIGMARYFAGEVLLLGCQECMPERRYADAPDCSSLACDVSVM